MILPPGQEGWRRGLDLFTCLHPVSNPLSGVAVVRTQKVRGLSALRLEETSVPTLCGTSTHSEAQSGESKGTKQPVLETKASMDWRRHSAGVIQLHGS